MNGEPRTALITGGSRGLGAALAHALFEQGWRVVVDGRDADRLRRSVPPGATGIPGDVADPAHRQALAEAVGDRLDLLVNNASTLGASPQPPLAEWSIADLEQVYRINVFAPLALFQAVRPALLRGNGKVLNISSDAAVEPYTGWGGYGSSKAALDQLTAVVAAENPQLGVYAVDPGDMATDLHQAAFPGEDISDRPAPATVIPALLHLIEADLPSGRYRASDLLAPASAS